MIRTPATSKAGYGLAIRHISTLSIFQYVQLRVFSITSLEPSRGLLIRESIARETFGVEPKLAERRRVELRAFAPSGFKPDYPPPGGTFQIGNPSENRTRH